MHAAPSLGKHCACARSIVSKGILTEAEAEAAS